MWKDWMTFWAVFCGVSGGLLVLGYLVFIWLQDIYRDKKVRNKILALMATYLTDMELNDFMITYVASDWKVRPAPFWKEKMQAFMHYNEPNENIEAVVAKILMIHGAIEETGKTARELMEQSGVKPWSK